MPQLIIPSIAVSDTHINIDQPALLKHMNVLRLQKGDEQDFLVVGTSEVQSRRYTTKVKEISKKKSICEIIAIQKSPIITSTVTMIVSIPLSSKKLNFIVQKCTEIGVDSIVFWSSGRSQRGKVDTIKLEKLRLVAKEAVEQSYGWNIPKISSVSKLAEYSYGDEPRDVVVFDCNNGAEQFSSPPCEGAFSYLVGIVGAEGGFSQEDHVEITEMFPSCRYVLLGKSVLRMETAAVIGSYVLKNI